MKERVEIVASGFGGQGVVRLGQIVGESGVKQGLRVAMLKTTRVTAKISQSVRGMKSRRLSAAQLECGLSCGQCYLYPEQRGEHLLIIQP